MAECLAGIERVAAAGCLVGTERVAAAERVALRYRPPKGAEQFGPRDERADETDGRDRQHETRLPAAVTETIRFTTVYEVHESIMFSFVES